MDFDFFALKELKEEAAWKLLNADNAPLVLYFLITAFINKGRASAPESELCDILSNIIYELNKNADIQYSTNIAAYLQNWTKSSWLNCSFADDGNADDPVYDITPSAQKALNFINSLKSYSFVGTQSRLMTIFNLLKQLNMGTETDPDLYIKELEKQRDELNLNIENAKKGILPKLDKTQIVDCFQQFEHMSRSLLSDFREVEYNFRDLDRNVRKKIALWDGSKGKLLDSIFNESDNIENSDQGKNSRAFSQLLLSGNTNDRIQNMIDHVYALEEIKDLNFDPQLKHIYDDWVAGSEQINRTVAKLSKQLRSFIDDRVFIENLRVMSLIQNVERTCAQIRDVLSFSNVKELPGLEIEIPFVEAQLPLERPLFSPKAEIDFSQEPIREGDPSEVDIPEALLLDLIDKNKLIYNIELMLNEKSEITLNEIINRFPVEYGLLEILTYLEIARSVFSLREDCNVKDVIFWNSFEENGDEVTRKAEMNRFYISFKDGGNGG